MTEKGLFIMATVGFLLFAGTQVGIVPIWMVIFQFIATATVAGASLTRGLGFGLQDDQSSATIYENTMSTWTKSLYQQQVPRLPVRQSWNCKNCGGPNVEQVQCQYCGMVKE